ncbi:MAG TPA: hypothetical protein VF331_25255 [Polyangiales bacterium]
MTTHGRATPLSWNTVKKSRLARLHTRYELYLKCSSQARRSTASHGGYTAINLRV